MVSLFVAQIRGLDQLESSEVLVAQNVFFAIIALVMVLAALKMVTTENIVHAALYLVIVLAGAAGMFILLGAEFIAVTQILVYIGAIIVLFLFGIMLLSPKPPVKPLQPKRMVRRRRKPLHQNITTLCNFLEIFVEKKSLESR